MVPGPFRLAGSLDESIVGLAAFVLNGTSSSVATSIEFGK